MSSYHPRYRSNVKYSRTSEAYELQQPSTKIVKKRRIKRVRAMRPVIRRVEGQKFGLSAYSIITIAVIFICAMSITVCYATTAGKGKEISAMAAQLKELQEANVLLELDNSSKLKLADIETIARTKLGMSEPKSHQIVHISVPKQSYAFQYDSQNGDISEKSFASKVLDFFQQVGNRYLREPL